MSKYLHIKLFLFFFNVFLLFPVTLMAQTVPTVTKPELTFRNDSLIIRYQFKDCQNQRFHVWLDVHTVDGKKLYPKTLSGDIGNNVPCGSNKVIYWNMAADSMYMDEVLYVKVMAETSVEVTVTEKGGNGKYFFASLLFPGSGLNLKMGNNKPYWLMGIVGYGGVATTLYFDQMARTNYNKYDQETDPVKRKDYYNSYEDYKKYRMISAISTGTVWLTNLIWTMVAKNGEPPKVSLGRHDLQFGTTVVTQTCVPGFTLKYTF